MKITIKNKEEKINLKLFFPSKMIFFILIKWMKEKKVISQENIPIYTKMSNDLSKLLKKYVKENGHFVLVDIESEGNKVFIKV